MYSGLISKIEKARWYAEEPDRVVMQEFALRFRGDNGDHDLSFNRGQWHCTCSFFGGHDVCSHTMAVQNLFGRMIPSDQPAKD